MPTRKQIDQRHELPVMTRAAEVQAKSLNEETRTVTVVVSTGARRTIRGWDGEVEEELPITPEALDLGRMNSVAPLLDNHRAFGSVLSILGAVVEDSARIEGGELVADIRFATTDWGEEAMKLVRDGSIRAVSVGYDAQYSMIRGRDRQDGGTVDLLTAIRWEPYEVSLVNMPADAGAKIRGEEPRTTRTYSVRYFEEQEPMPQRNAPAEPTGNGTEKAPAQTRAPEPKALGIAEAAALITSTRSLLERNQLDATLAEKLVVAHEGDETKIRAALLDLITTRSDNTRVSGHVQVSVGEEAGTKQRAAIVDGIMHRLQPETVKLDETSGRYRRMSMLDIAKMTLESRGISTRGRSDEEIARLATRSTGDGFHSTSDFPGLLSDVANRRLRNGYKAQEPVWKQFGRRQDFNNFNAINVYKISDFPDLETVAEGGEYTNGTLTESSESYRGVKSGRIVALSWESILADDLRAFEQGLRSAGQAAVRRENRAFYNQLTGGTIMGDGVALFDGSRGNISGVGGAASISVLSAALTTMATQVGDGPDSSEPLDIMPKYILCPQTQRVGYQLATGLDQRRAPSTLTDQLPPEFEALSVLASGWLDPIDDKVSYLIANPAMIDTLEYGYLRGQEGPEVIQEESFRGDGTAFKVRHSFALKIIEPSAFVKIPSS